MRGILTLMFFMMVFWGSAQNKQLLYDFNSVPQHGLLNPGAVIEQKFFVGVPILSQVSFDVGGTPFSVYDLFSVNGTSINSKLRAAVSGFGKTEFVNAHQQIEILTAGFRIRNKGFMSAGIYQESNLFFKVPKDVLDLWYYGNNDLGRTYSIEKTHAFGELINVFHVGYNVNVSDDLIVGGRFKIYSSAFHGSATGTKGSLTTRAGTTNLIAHNFDNVHMILNTSGIPGDEDDDVSPSDVMNRLLLGGNLGIGIDVGFTKFISENLKITGSMLDFGFVNYSKEVRNFNIKGEYFFEGAELLFEDTFEDYWNNYRQDFEEAFEDSENSESYIKMRPLKFNAGLHYSFGEKRDLSCNYASGSKQYLNKLSGHFFALMSDVHTRIAGTIAYERWFSKHFQLKVSYTGDSFSYTNIGLGGATQLGPVQFYLLANNMLHIDNLYDAQALTLQLGINLNFYDLN